MSALQFDAFGGQYVPETLVGPLAELDAAWQAASVDPAFVADLEALRTDYSGRPTPLFEARRLSAQLGLRVLLKREDLNHTGAHKINNTLGQALLARRMGRTRLVAETGAGQHGVASATAAALLGMPCVVYMGAKDVARQALNVYRMQLLGAEVRPVATGSQTLKDAVNAAIRDWIGDVEQTYYLLGSAVGPHPYPTMVRELQSVIGREARAQVLARDGRLPDVVVACVGGGSNAIGMFAPFAADADVRLIGVEAAGTGLDAEHAATLCRGRPGILHGTLSLLLQDGDGQVAPVHSISAGLDYPGVGPELAAMHARGRLEAVAVTDDEALAAVGRLCRSEGILPALESAHAIAWLLREPRPLAEGLTVAVCLSGRGDKDIEILREHTQ